MKLKSEILHLRQCVLNVRYSHVYKIVTQNILCNLNNLYKYIKLQVGDRGSTVAKVLR